MNLVQTLPVLQKASLNGVNGLGYAEAIAGINQTGSIHGVIVFDEDSNLENFSERKEMLFEGIVYRDGSEVVESIEVELVLFNRDLNEAPGATFIGKAG